MFSVGRVLFMLNCSVVWFVCLVSAPPGRILSIRDGVKESFILIQDATTWATVSESFKEPATFGKRRGQANAANKLIVETGRLRFDWSAGIAKYLIRYQSSWMIRWNQLPSGKYWLESTTFPFGTVIVICVFVYKTRRWHRSRLSFDVRHLFAVATSVWFIDTRQRRTHPPGKYSKPPTGRHCCRFWARPQCCPPNPNPRSLQHLWNTKESGKESGKNSSAINNSTNGSTKQPKLIPEPINKFKYNLFSWKESCKIHQESPYIQHEWIQKDPPRILNIPKNRLEKVEWWRPEVQSTIKSNFNNRSPNRSIESMYIRTHSAMSYSDRSHPICKSKPPNVINLNPVNLITWIAFTRYWTTKHNASIDNDPINRGDMHHQV